MTYVIIIVISLKKTEVIQLLVKDKEKLEKYIKQYQINDYFSSDLTSHMKLFYFKNREFIYREEDDFDYLYFFVEGKAKVFNSTVHGRSLLLCFYEPFQILGDIELINETKITTNVEVIHDSYCVGISSEIARKYALDDPIFLKYICQTLGSKLNRSSKNSSLNLLYPLENRLASYILGIGVHHGEDGDYFTFFDSLTEISELLGTSYRHLLRTLNNLVKEGLIKKAGKGYRVLNMVELEAMAIELYKRVSM